MFTLGLFDNINGNSNNTSYSVGAVSNKTVDVVFERLPDNFEQFKALPQASLFDPFSTAALTVLAFCFYPQDKETSLVMVDYLRGPRPLSNMDKSFIADRFRDADYVPRSYFKGANPQNNYNPSQPYTVTVFENPYSYDTENYAKLFITSGGADSPRNVMLRKAKDGKWYLWEQYILVGIRQPESTNPWA